MNFELFIKKYIHYVSFEMSNICIYSDKHKRCPLNKVESKISLPYSIMSNVIDFLSKYNFNGMIGFNSYNEPLMDPRLYLLISEIRSKLDKSVFLSLWTNGFYMNQTVLDELWSMYRVDHIMVSTYSKEEEDRISHLTPNENMRYEFVFRTLDDRMDFYTNPIVDYNKPCGAPLNEITIGCNGELVLCCLDYEKRHTFGNLNKNSFEEVLINNEKEMISIYNNLMSGNREFEICKRCGWSRVY